MGFAEDLEVRTAYQDRLRDLIDIRKEPPEKLEPLSPTGGPLKPVKRPKYHSDQCYCEDCADLRAAVEIYVKQKRLLDENGFI